MADTHTTTLADRSAVITGASSGIGRATALALAGAGASVVLAARREERLQSLRQEIEDAGGRALVVATDVTDREQVGRLIDTTRDAFGTVDILVNNAGLMPLSLMKNLHEEEWNRMVDVNIKGVLHGIAAALPVMREQGRGHIVNLSSVAGRKVFPGGAVYCATKFAVRALSEGLRMELSPSEGIRITSIEPGAVDTELAEAIEDEEVQEQMAPLFEELTILESEDIADAILWAVTRPARVNVNEVLIRPTDQEL